MSSEFGIQIYAAERRVAQRALLVGIIDAAEQRHWLDEDGNCSAMWQSHVLAMLVGAQKASEALGLKVDLLPRPFLSLAAGFDPIELIRFTLEKFDERMPQHDRMVANG
ncbi:hypothetical protein [Sphingomonas sp. SRS2]|uniref:hypothetical protein n=1 Tax=Sphingomonas sp. SRS2 TaxID=133190 RepID=UPI0006184E45|nr:hypothetical protein [Sphingomonas sp. SRS2]KKC27423.1 hypothetical protein WP12_03315 [Sphingomonas sp. SRS2]